MKYLIPLIVLALAVCGFAYFTLFSSPTLTQVAEEAVPTTSPADQTEPTERTQPVVESFDGTGSLYSLLTRGDTKECTITYTPPAPEPAVTGTVFTAGADLRGDFVVPTPDLSGQMVTSIIIADDSIWQWTAIDDDVFGSRQAADYAVPTLEKLVAPIGFVIDVQYDCRTWPAVDETIFDAPATVLFTDASTAEFEEGVVYPEGEGGEF